MTKTTPATYSRSMRLLHWAGVAAVIGAVGLGFIQGSVGASRGWLLGAHLLMGVLVVGTTLARLFIGRRAERPAPLPMPAWRSALMRVVHSALYLTLLALGLSGIGTAVAGGVGPALFGGQAIPNLEALFPREVHVTLVIAFLVSLGLHIAGLVSYQAREGDALGRMAGRPMPTGATRERAVSQRTPGETR